ncbi:hypothetical protein EIP86_006179 [Pleurotus ostreatoroseus]|nr:hypothetical protein EIP86_006179 [Pleurotus ostreatoroseus]
MHLIQAHGYPKEFFFAVTNKGVGGLLRKWGEGASLVRGQWRPRGEDEHDMDVDDNDDDDDVAEEELDTEAASASMLGPTLAIHSHDTHKVNDTVSKAGQQLANLVPENTIPIPAQVEKTVSGSTSSGWLSGTPLVEDSSPSSSEHPTPERNKNLAQSGRRGSKMQGGGRGNHNHVISPAAPAHAGNGEADSLTQAMGALSLVPSSIRFGRGASRARGAPGQVHGPRIHARRQDGEHGMDVDSIADLSTADGQGRRGRRGGSRGHSRNVSAASTVGATVNAAASAPEPAGVEARTDVIIGEHDNRGRGRSRGRPPMPPRGLGRGGRARLGLGVGFGARMR